MRSWLLALFPDEDLATALLDIPAINRAQSRCAYCLTAAHIEACMVPRTAHRFPNYDAVRKRSMIMAAVSADREQFRTRANQQHFLVADVANQPTIDEVGERNTLRQIRATRRSLFLGHCCLVLSPSSRAKEFLAKLRVVAEAAKHTTCDQIGVRFVHAARRHAVVRRLDHNADA